jgi:ethanolamine ammonia-lyase small subunit
MQITRRSNGKRWKRLVAVVNNISKLRDIEMLYAKGLPILAVEANLNPHQSTVNKLTRAGDNETTLIQVHQQNRRLQSLDQWLSNLERNAVCILRGRRRRNKKRSRVLAYCPHRGKRSSSNVIYQRCGQSRCLGVFVPT